MNTIPNEEFLKTVSSEVIQHVDSDGVITEEVSRNKIVVGEPGEFFQLYAAVIPLMEKGLKPIEAKIFVSMFTYVNSVNQLALTKGFKEEIAQKNSISYSAVANAVTRLVSLNLLIRSSQSTYRVNPRYFWKSNSQSRKATLKYVLEVECPNC